MNESIDFVLRQHKSCSFRLDLLRTTFEYLQRDFDVSNV
jgi:hypothetical protein